MQSLMLKINISSVNQALHAHSRSHPLFKPILQWLQNDLWSLDVVTVVVECYFESLVTNGLFFLANIQ